MATYIGIDVSDGLNEVEYPVEALTDEAAKAMMERWNRPCEGAFDLLSERFPYDLAKLIENDRLEPSDLTFAAEALGRSSISDLVRRTLVPLLGHDSAVVREGAIYGLQRHINSEIRSTLEEISHIDDSPAVRTAAENTLSDPTT